MRIGIDLQSVSAIITNSSSEVFTVKAEMPISELKQLITEIADKNYFKGSWKEWEKLSDEEMNKYDSSSGMGGELEIQTFDDLYTRYKFDEIPENKREFFTKEIYSLMFKESIEELEKRLWIDIDEARRGTIQWIINNLNVIGCTGYCRIDPETKRVVELVGYSEWDKLPENERNY